MVCPIILFIVKLQDWLHMPGVRKMGESMTKASETNYAIELKGITKTFGSVVANSDINLTVKCGEILALLGENGSGKTTLMNMLSGIYYPDKGSISVAGKEVSISSPTDAIELGIGMIHQHFKLVEVFSAMDNIVIGTKEKHLKRKVLKDKIAAISERFGLEIDPENKVYNMSVSEKQTVEIMKVLYRGAEILILDEPTAVLTPQETEKLFAILRRMKEQGSAIIIITHKLNEVMAISDRVAILRKGHHVATVMTAETNEKQLTELMVGRPVSLEINRPETEDRKPVLKVLDLSVENEHGSLGLRNVSFSLRSGEILGVAGIAGSGQKELCESIAGLVDIKEGAVLYNKKNIIGMSPDEIIELGISMSFVPEDRLGMGLVGSMGMVENMMLKSYKKNPGIFVDKKPARKLAEELIEKLCIVTPNVDMPVRRMSGGNVQKVLLGREIESKPNVLITAYPVRGLDINSSYLIYDLLNEQKEKGVAVLFVGEDLDVLLELSDRIMVLCHGELKGIVDAKATTKEELGLMMTGRSLEGVDSDE
jgi:simple sugar transport system ATP-binding protein